MSGKSAPATRTVSPAPPPGADPAPRETAGKTPPEQPKLIPQPNGGALLSGGMPGNKGGGRKPDAWKEIMQELASSQEVIKQAEQILSNRNHAAFKSVWQFVAEQAYGKPETTTNLRTPDADGLRIHVVDERKARRG